MTRFDDLLAARAHGADSRFSRVPGIAFVPGEDLEHEVHTQHRGDLGAARQEAVRRSVGEWALEDQPDLGRVSLHDAGAGVGAEAWAVVLQWAGAGVVGGAAWVVTVATARRLAAFVARFRSESHRRPIVTAGAARLLAINAVLAHNADESGPLDTQAIEEASTVGGAEPITLAFGEEPWLVLLVTPRSACRYFGVVQADGEVVGIVSVPLGPTERHVGVRVEIPGS